MGAQDKQEAQAAELLGAPLVTGSFVLGRGSSVRKGIAAATAGAGVRTGSAAADAEFGGVGFLAVTASEVALFSGKQGLLRPSITALLMRAPRAQLRRFTLDRGALLVKGELELADGRCWTFEVPKARAKAIAQVEEVLLADLRTAEHR